VVVGIIVVVMSLLLTAVMRARRSGRDTVCLNNLREIGHLVLMYAEQNDDLIPIGTGTFWKRMGSDIHTAGNWTSYAMVNGQPSSGLGPLVLNGMINRETAKILYCPLDPDPRLTWKLNQDKFPSRGQEMQPVSVRISYWSRPGAIFPHAWGTPDEITARALPTPLMVRLNDMLNKALFADGLGDPFSHGSEKSPRINVLYNDGAAISMPANWGAEYRQQASFPKVLSPETPATITGSPEIWTAVLDRK
jgi:hypothetical protein